jgi:hypothetical protein
MPKNNVSDLITDQEIAFARLILSGTMTDRQAAEALGLHPDSAAYTKSKPRVRAYMLEHRAAVQQHLVEQDTEELRRFNVGRDQVLTRLWDIANMDPERTRNSMSAQVKALSMIVAIEGLIPDRHSDRRAVSAQNQPAPPPVHPPFYVSEWARTRKDGESVDPQPPPTPAQVQVQAQEEGTAPEPQSTSGRADGRRPVSSPTPNPTPMELSSRPERSVVEGPAVPGLEPLANDVIAASRPYVRFVPDARVPFSIPENPCARRR